MTTQLSRSFQSISAHFKFDARSFNGEQAPAGQAIVIGGGMSGLMAAQVLSQHFAKVTIVDRDHLTESLEVRNGVPQARHPHTLMVRGQEILEQHFPGLTGDLIGQGALPIDASREVAFFVAGDWYKPTRHADTMAIAMSRPLLEMAIYRRVRANPRIQIRHAHEVVSISTDAQRQRVTGLVVHDRDGAPSVQTRLHADMVVDASGRQSQVPQWLQALGYTPADELTVNTFVGYSTRVYQKPADFAEDWKALYIRPTVKTGTRGGMIIPLEGNRWIVALLGASRDYPPTDEAGFMEFARSLPTPKLFEAIHHAEPLTKPIGYRRTDSRLRRYDQLPRYLDGLLVMGDAACILNPVHAQGITAAAIGSQALSENLQAHFNHHPAGDVRGLAAAFQKQLHHSLAELWNTIAHDDRRWPAAEVRHLTPVSSEQMRREQVRRSMAIARVTL
jgi:2-polyprenyl-6-methoxyphenol hydroxylase-like FAD-dependent oxidoreductase